ncbi:sulfatase family protein [Fodinibius sediminis]|uniref:Arylsulfatase A n=1 Tax=Fodinibius sediminis TaxID=1214077 RepID=A0A521DQ37_9BACT|nr:arylsulfatase [Fodinibius sediminis]SMO73722.1 Arylsulfatase A [Fodinibius sediminis]
MISDNFWCISFIMIMMSFLGSCNTENQSNEGDSSNPNIVILFADDMGYGDVGAYNKESRISTPHIDRLARGGMRFMDAHAPGAVCHPSRYGLLTGRYPFRTDVSVWPHKPVIDENRMTVASLLQSEGYRTAMVGKWHLGFDESGGYSEPLPGGPVDRGFDRFFGIRASTDIPPYFYIDGNQAVTPPTDSIGSNSSEGWSPIQGAFWRAGGIAPELQLKEVLPRFTEEAVNIIHSHGAQQSGSPLFLYVALPAPHTPWLPAEVYEGQSEAGMYGDFMTMVDAKLGEILGALRQSGMDKETLVIFTSDNGPVWYDKNVDQLGHDSSGGLRGMKGDAYEAGHRMPFIVRWPGVVSGGSVTEQTVSFTDLLATFADIIDAELPDDAGEDSFSLLPVLRGEQDEQDAVRPPVVSVSSRGVKSIQDGRWKLIEGLGSGGFSKPSHVEPGPGDPQGQLYNLAEDPAEQNNLWQDHPDVVQRLRKKLRAFEQRGRSRP